MHKPWLKLSKCVHHGMLRERMDARVEHLTLDRAQSQDSKALRAAAVARDWPRRPAVKP
jgi:hypothetical protein